MERTHELPRPAVSCVLSAVGLLVAVTGCATMPTVRLNQGAVQSSLQALEADVLEESRRFKEQLEASGAVYERPELQSYLEGLLQPLAPQHAEAGRYRFSLNVVQDPTLNAYTLGDGSLYAHTGLIARLRTAEQFAFVMAHEIGHVMNRDLVYFTDALHRKTIAAKLTGLIVTPALAAVGAGGLGELGLNTVYVASVNGFGRERESAADQEALATMRRLGLDEREALRVFEAFLAEHERYDRGIEVSFLSSHPSNEERLKTARIFMGPKALDVFTPEKVDHAFLDATQELRIDNAALNIKLGRLYHATEDLQIILRRTPQDARARFHLAEAYRLIAEDPEQLKRELSRKAWNEIKDVADAEQHVYWQTRSFEEYQHALTADPNWAEPHRGLGLLQVAQGKPREALQSLQRYLELAPNAKDRRFVLSQIARLEPPLAKRQEP